MEGTHLRLSTYENRKFHGRLVHEWLLEQARGLGIAGGSAYRAIAGCCRAGELHEMHCYELAGKPSSRCRSSSSRHRRRSTACWRLPPMRGLRCSGSGTRPTSASFPEPDAAGQATSPRAFARASRRASSFSLSFASMPRVVGS